ncbi:MAG: hypothetical protein JW918_15955 [Anaerolineae bacterium]|nr:hypothetical protein [Anaerolineae bacterium]
MRVQDAKSATEGAFAIDVTRGVVAFLIAGIALVAVAGYVMLADRPVVASQVQAPAADPSSVAPRRYYLTAATYQGDEVNTACTDMYHMAAIWELMDVSNLAYAANLAPGMAMANTDMGDGPPAGVHGWVRTGHGASTGNTEGQANCSAWTSNSFLNEYGTATQLPLDWASGANMSIWEVTTYQCHQYIRVWCVED